MIERRLGNKVWTAEQPNSSELETQEFLYGLVRVLKPITCVETGTFRGEAAWAIAKALKENGCGHLHTCEIDKQLAQDAALLLSHYPVAIYHEDSLSVLSRIKNVDFAFIDGGSNRTAEMGALQLSNQAYVVLHDAKNPDYLPPLKWLDYRVTKLCFPHPLGLAVFEVKR